MLLCLSQMDWNWKWFVWILHEKSTKIVLYICSMSIMDGSQMNRQPWLPTVVAAAVSIQPFLFLPKVEVLTRLNFWDDMDPKVCCAVKRAALKILLTKIERYVPVYLFTPIFMFITIMRLHCLWFVYFCILHFSTHCHRVFCLFLVFTAAFLRKSWMGEWWKSNVTRNNWIGSGMS